MLKFKICKSVAFVFAVTMLVLSACGGGGGGGGTVPAGAAPFSVDSTNEAMDTLSRAAAVEWESLLVVMDILSEDGTVLPFDETVTISDADLIDMEAAALSVIEEKERFDLAVAFIAAQGGASRVAPFLSDAWDFGKSFINYNENMRDVSSKVINKMSAEEKVSVYNVLKEAQANGKFTNYDFGDNFSSFYENMNNGDYDKVASNIHRYLYDEGGDLNRDYDIVSSYTELSQSNNVTPGQVGYREIAKVAKAGAKFMVSGASAVTPVIDVAAKTVDYVDKVATVVKPGSSSEVTTPTAKTELKTRVKKLHDERPQNRSGSSRSRSGPPRTRPGHRADTDGRRRG